MKNIVKSRWLEILDYVKTELKLSDVSFKTWLLPLQVYDVRENKILISVDDAFINSRNLEYVQNKYGLHIKIAVAEITNMDYDVEFYLSSTLNNSSIVSPSIKESGTNDTASFLNPRYTFETFVVGPNNNFAHAAALAVAESPATVYNPLFIYGGVGLGKTHLMHSIAHFIIQKNPNYKVLYVTSELFTNDVIQAIRYGKQSPEDLRKKYRSLDVLLIDDIQFVIGKESTQEEFFHTFNSLYESKKQIIISSDKPPKDILTLEDRLRSRFEWGLTVDIQSPNYETRMAILRKKQETDGLSIEEEIIEYIASNVKSNIRELEGSLTKVVAMSKLKKQSINLSLAEEALKDIISPDNKKTVDFDLIVEVVTEHYNITPMEILSDNRSQNVSFPRQIIMYLCRKLTPLSLSDIGTLLNKKDHTTILHGIKKIEDKLEKEATFQNVVDVLIKKINPQI